METFVALIVAAAILYWLFAPKPPAGPPTQAPRGRCRCRR